MLEQNDLLVYAGWVVVKVIVLNALLWSTGPLILDSFDIAEVEQVLAHCDDLCAIVEENSVSTIAEFIAETILGTEVNELGDEFGTRLLLTLSNQITIVNSVSSCSLNLCEFLVILLLSW